MHLCMNTDVYAYILSRCTYLISPSSNFTFAIPKWDLQIFRLVCEHWVGPCAKRNRFWMICETALILVTFIPIPSLNAFFFFFCFSVIFLIYFFVNMSFAQKMVNVRILLVLRRAVFKSHNKARWTYMTNCGLYYCFFLRFIKVDVK